MDERVRTFVDQLANARAIDPVEVRDQIWELFLTFENERGRVALLSMYDAVMRITIGHTAARGDPTAGLVGAIAADKCAFALLEAMPDQENVDDDLLRRIIGREVAAGRMRGDELANFGEDAAAVLRTQRAAWLQGTGNSQPH